MTKMHIPQFLTPGDKVLVVSPSGKIDGEIVDRGMTVLSKWGLVPVCGTSCKSSCGRFAGDDDARFLDLKNALSSADVKAVFCSRGGYGAVRLLERLSDDMIAARPKWLVGYSDITLLHAAFRKAGIVSLHAPMMKHLAEDKDDRASGLLRDMLFGKWPAYTVEGHPLNRPGTAVAPLFGGNLSVLSGLRGTPFDVIKKGDILFVEDIAERPYHVERMFYNLKLSGVLPSLSGLIVGQFTDYVEDSSLGMTVYEMIRNMVAAYDYPVCFGFPVGHVKDNFPMPEGMPVRLSVTAKRVVLTPEIDDVKYRNHEYVD